MIRIVIVFGLTSFACATTRPPLAQAWCKDEDDRQCGRRFAALYGQGSIFDFDESDREGMLSWFRYRCGLDPTSKEVVEGANEAGLDCFRAAQLLLLKGSSAASQKMAERGCEEFDSPQSCLFSAAFARERFDLRTAHALECKARRAAEEKAEPLPGYEALDCEPGSETGQRLRAAEMARLGHPGAPVSLVQCAMHGCTESGGRYIKAWIDN